MKLLVIRQRPGTSINDIIYPVTKPVTIRYITGKPTLCIGNTEVLTLDDNNKDTIMDSLSDGWGRSDVCVIINHDAKG